MTKMMMTVTRRRIGTSMLGRINAHRDVEGARGVELELPNVRRTREENLWKVERLEMPAAAGFCRDDRRGTLLCDAVLPSVTETVVHLQLLGWLEYTIVCFSFLRKTVPAGGCVA